MDCRNVFGCAEKQADEFIEGMTQLGCLRVRREAGARLLRGARLQRRRAEKTDIALPPGGVRRVRHRRRRGVRETLFRKGGLPDLLPPEARRYEMSTPPIILIVDDDSSHRAMLRTELA